MDQWINGRYSSGRVVAVRDTMGRPARGRACAHRVGARGGVEDDDSKTETGAVGVEQREQ
ncbi:hypothetical protein O9K51_05416 [Purpureocillium lavendulum]|uniref:Uncharacterized protein n=1 Tax=Purpureocillium lavendulum TaxID=1247861 RepID=A0AB34FRK3_9HYPO|nr:hypothetical protein O9K51_05416 [Purpureocillium lavendulum]